MQQEEKELGRRIKSLLDVLIRRMALLSKDQKVCYGLTVPQCRAVEMIGGREQITMNELSLELGVTVSTMTRVIDVLVRDGVVSRCQTVGDRRKVCVSLTDTGRELEQKLKACTDLYIHELLNRLPAEKKRDVLEALELLNRAVEDTVGKMCCR